MKAKEWTNEQKGIIDKIKGLCIDLGRTQKAEPSFIILDIVNKKKMLQIKLIDKFFVTGKKKDKTWWLVNSNLFKVIPIKKTRRRHSK